MPGSIDPEGTVSTVRPGRGALRLARSLAAALGCLVAAAGAHRSAGGVVPVEVVVALTVGAVAVAWMLASRRLTRGQLTGLVILAQVVVHTACAGDQMTMSATMLAVHLLATALIVVALDHGETIAWRVARHLALRPIAVLQTSAAPVHRAAAPMGDTTVLPAVFDETTRPVRGPPIGV